MNSTGSSTTHEAIRATGDGLSALGAVLALLGLFRALLVLDALPADAGSWWPTTLLVVAAWLAVRGRQGAALTLGTLGAGLLAVVNVPGEYFGPALLITVGVLVVIATVAGRRIATELPGLAGIALFGDRDVRMGAGMPAQPVIAVFGESDGHVEEASFPDDVVTCLALFGEASLTVPRDAVVEVRPLAVFGDVRAPEPPAGTPSGRVRVRATAVFGDVRVLRA